MWETRRFEINFFVSYVMFIQFRHQLNIPTWTHVNEPCLPFSHTLSHFNYYLAPEIDLWTLCVRTQHRDPLYKLNNKNKAGYVTVFPTTIPALLITSPNKIYVIILWCLLYKRLLDKQKNTGTGTGLVTNYNLNQNFSILFA